MAFETEFPPADAPMAKMLSVILVIGQWVLVGVFLLLIGMALLMIVPNGLRSNLTADLASPLHPTTLASDCFIWAMITAAWFFVLRLLSPVVKALSQGDPFLPENVSRLRMIWIVITATELFRMAAKFLMGGLDPSLNGVSASLDIRIGTWFFIFIIAAISEAFRHGAALRAEQELTI